MKVNLLAACCKRIVLVTKVRNLSAIKTQSVHLKFLNGLKKIRRKEISLFLSRKVKVLSFTAPILDKRFTSVKFVGMSKPTGMILRVGVETA